jgi:hypothetical protein
MMRNLGLLLDIPVEGITIVQINHQCCRAMIMEITSMISIVDNVGTRNDEEDGQDKLQLYHDFLEGQPQ